MRPPPSRPWLVAAMAALAVLGVDTRDAFAYIGPGAGIAFVSSFFVLLTTLVVALVSVVLWPIRMLIRLASGKTPRRTSIGRLIVVGLDGQDPKLTDQFMAEGLLPNFAKLAQLGCYRPLRTTFPSVSPVAWSSFSTGTNPGRHNIFDFLDRDRRTYLPMLSSAKIGSVKRFLTWGRYRIPLERPELRLLRKSKPFWTILGEHRIWSTVLRVPVTFPPDSFYGAELSAMCVPDLLGTQGTFLLFTTRPTAERFQEGGIRVLLERAGNRLEGVVEGPENTFVKDGPPLRLPFSLHLDKTLKVARLHIAADTLELSLGELTPWVTLSFRAAPGVVVSGLTRIQLLELGDHVSLYMSPININPEKPAMPVSHPSYYSTYLAKRVGPYSTLGLAEDTWALNEGVIDDATFLRQAYDIDGEREQMFFAALDRLRKGTLVCVFDATDRIQHMFWRYLEDGHPAGAGRDDAEHRHAIRELYQHNDKLIGKVMGQLNEDDVLMVLSDHGFSSFRRGVNLNSWLRREGYLVMEPGFDGTDEWLRHVDWSTTRAYCLGLTGMFLNLEGREERGIVKPVDAQALKAELIGRLNGLRDDDAEGAVAVREVFDTQVLYDGPYLENAPDLLIGYNAGYRTSWDCARGISAGPVCEDNVKAWSGDHCIDPRLVPGVFFCNRRTDAEDPSLVDIAPTALRLFGIDPPAYMDGRALSGLT